jgi:hypothetical protein
LLEVAACKPAAEPLHTLLGAAVGNLGNHLALRAFLHLIVADLCSIQAFFDIACPNAALMMRMVRPDAGQAIRLKFER